MKLNTSWESGEYRCDVTNDEGSFTRNFVVTGSKTFFYIILTYWLCFYVVLCIVKASFVHVKRKLCTHLTIGLIKSIQQLIKT